MKIVLVDNLVMPERRDLDLLDVHPHLGLLMLATVAEASGHEVQIYDPKRLVRSRALRYDATIYHHVADELLGRRPDAVGFTTLGCSFVFAVQVAAELKRREPELPILLGGPHATMLDRAILDRFRQFDVVVRHEADETFPAILDNLERRRFDWIPGVTWRAGAAGIRTTEGRPKVEDLDTLPIASYEHYPIAELGLHLLRIEAGRGCPFACTFCSTAGFFQRSFRLKSAERLVHELDLLHARYGSIDFKLDHDMFTVNRKKVVEFCEAVAPRGYRWQVSARVDCVDADLLALMAKSGCTSLYFGIETGSERMQAITKKRLDLDLVMPILGAAASVGIATTASFITGYPEEQDADQDDTLDMLGRCVSPSCLAQLHMLVPEPGTPMYDAHGVNIQLDGYITPYNAALVGATDEITVRDNRDIFQTYHHYPTALARARHVFAVETVHVLRGLGPIVLEYLLRGYDGRLSELLRTLRNETGGAVPRAADIIAHTTTRFGAGHHVTSLVRYALCPPLPAPTTNFNPAGRYQRSPHVLPEIHDCELALTRIGNVPLSAELLDNADFGELGVYVRVGGHTYWIDPGADAIARLFERPHTCNEVTQELRELVGDDVIDPQFFAELVRVGLLVATPP